MDREHYTRHIEVILKKGAGRNNEHTGGGGAGGGGREEGGRKETVLSSHCMQGDPLSLLFALEMTCLIPLR